MTKMIISQNTKPRDIVLYYFGEADEEDIDYILWNKTSYPFGYIEWLNEEVYSYYLQNRR